MSSKTRTSKIWDYYTRQDSKKGKAICNNCKAVISNTDGCTSAMTKHLNMKHGINIHNKRSEIPEDEPSKKITKTILDYSTVTKRSLEEIVSRLATVDGISIRAITRSEFIRESIVKCNYVLPKNESDVMKLIYKDFETKKEIMINELQGKLNKNKRFSITLDEWTSVGMKRFLNINLHDNEFKTFNLGLVRIYGSCSSSALVELVTNHLNTFHINFEKDVVSSTNDGAKMMIKYGRECPAISQLCLNHGIHLAVCDTLYKSQIISTTIKREISTDDNDTDSDDENFENDNIIISSDDSTLNELELKSVDIHKNIMEVRKIIKFFKQSTIKNEILQEKIKADLGHELQLILDVKTRWNSMQNMIDNFLRVKSHIVEVLRELNSESMLININFTLLSELNLALKPIKLTVEALSRKDATLISTDLALNFMQQKLKESTTQISCNLLANISKRIEERKNSELINLLKCLKKTNSVPSKEHLRLAADLMKRLFSIDVNEDNSEGVEKDVLIQSENLNNSVPMEKELENILKNSMIEPDVRNDFNKLKQEFMLFRNTGKRTPNLQNLYEALLTIKPTSTDAERTFSISANFCTKIRSRLSEQSINVLVFLKCFYLNNKK